MRSAQPTGIELPTSVCVVGAGYVGLTAAACLARFGHRVCCLEANGRRLAILQQGGVPMSESGLSELIAEGRASGRLRFTDAIDEALDGTEIVFLCVGTPPGPGNRPDLRQIGQAARQIARAARTNLIIVVKSTVPPGTCEALELLCQSELAANTAVQVVSHPEFLREGHAVDDFFHPDRIVVGAVEREIAQRIVNLYPPGPPALLCDRRTAELVKYAANTFLALKISFANEVAELCERLGADAPVALSGVGLDERIGHAFLGPGPGFGGSCLPKDLAGFMAIGEIVEHETFLAHAAQQVNGRAQARLLAKLDRVLGGLQEACIAVLGLAFKAGTDDVRDSPAVALIEALLDRGAAVRVYDPLAPCPERRAQVSDDPYDAARGADAVVVTTAWPEFATLDPNQMAEAVGHKIVVDAVSVLNTSRWRAAGFQVYGVGHGVGIDFYPVTWRLIEWMLDDIDPEASDNSA